MIAITADQRAAGDGAARHDRGLEARQVGIDCGIGGRPARRGEFAA